MVDERLIFRFSDLMDTRSNLLTLFDTYRAANGVKASALSLRVFGHTKKIELLRKGGGIVACLADASLEWFSTNWPAQIPWPADIPHPTSNRKALE